MARDINDRLNSLNTRRKGTDRFNDLAFDQMLDVLAKSLVQENYQKRAISNPYTRYALGAMQEVGADYTRIGIETATRVGKQLVSGLSMGIDFRLQGSVPLNVHIRGVSDVDLLVLDASYHTYDRTGALSAAGFYTGATARTSVDVLGAMRREAEPLLKKVYPAAKVDCSGAKCIALSGGSLARPVDVVPSHWHDNITYQTSRQEHHRGVVILDKNVPTTISNLPFLHIQQIEHQDGLVYGGLKKAIRLAKNVKNDAENQITAEKLPSFDIAALLWHADPAMLRIGYTYELAILLEAQRLFDWCYNNRLAACRLMTPDGTRAVLNTTAKLDGLRTISVELDNLAKEVAKEHSLPLRQADAGWEQIRQVLTGTAIPVAA